MPELGIAVCDTKLREDGVMSDSPARAPSIRDVARVAEVSYQTVSRVLNDHPSVREATKERVLAAMSQLQFRPSRAARTLVTRRSGMIGVLAAAGGSHYGPVSSISAIEDASREAGYTVTIANVDPSEAASIGDALDHLLAQNVEGIVVVAPQARVLQAITALPMRVPFVTLQSPDPDAHAFSVDQLAGARAATRHLLDLGHTRIFHLAGPQDWIEAEARMRGFLEELSDSGVPTTAPIMGDWTADFGYRAGVELLNGPRDFTAVFSSNDQMALGLLHAFREAGLDVPGDVSVVGFDDIPEAAHFWPPLTTVRQDFRELGRRGIDLLLRELGDETVREPGTITPQLVVRESTRRVVSTDSSTG
jgi:DNA-binding LacI/PurR family transcriptional regulator